MKEYLSALFFVSVIAALVRTLSPSGGMKKHMEFVCSLCVIAALVLPCAQLFSDFNGIDDLFGDSERNESDYDKIYNSFAMEEGVRQSERILSEELCQLTSEKNGSISLKLVTEETDGALRVTGAKAIIYGEAVDTDPRIIKEHIKSRVGCECEIIYKLFDE